MSIDQKTISAIAYLVHGEAQRLNRRWDQQGIHAQVRGALEDDGHSVAEVIAAGFAAVEDPNSKTPAAIRWADRYAGTIPGTEAWINAYGPGCLTCGRTQRHHDIAESKLPLGVRHPFKADRPHTFREETPR